MIAIPLIFENGCIRDVKHGLAIVSAIGETVSGLACAVSSEIYPKALCTYKCTDAKTSADPSTAYRLAPATTKLRLLVRSKTAADSLSTLPSDWKCGAE